MEHLQPKELAESALILNEISNHILKAIRVEGLDSVLDHRQENMYRTSFKRVAIKPQYLEPWRGAIDIDAMAVEVIWTLDNAAEVHWHEHAYAVLSTLGPWEGIEEPMGSFIYFKNGIYAAESGITLQVLPGTLHGFGTPEGANSVVFLSVQSRAINEDFHTAH